MSKILPNSFQCPNAHVDDALRYLDGDEVKCLLFAARHILGWQDRINCRRGTISLSMFSDGYVTDKGTVYGGTGLARATVQRAVGELHRFGLLVKVGKPSKDGQEYEIGSDPNWDAMAQREKARQERQALRTATLNQRRAEKKASKQSSGSHGEPVTAVHDMNQERFTARTDSGSHGERNQIQLQSQLQNHKVEDEFDQKLAAVIQAFHARFAMIANATQADILKDIARDYELDDIRDAFQIAAANGKGLLYAQGVLRNRAADRNANKSLPPAAAKPVEAPAPRLKPVMPMPTPGKANL